MRCPMAEALHCQSWWVRVETDCALLARASYRSPSRHRAEQSQALPVLLGLAAADCQIAASAARSKENETSGVFTNPHQHSTRSCRSQLLLLTRQIICHLAALHMQRFQALFLNSRLEL
mmetsp:Transcript_23550/g.60427  ORF Transcript_23550/g.60427 Transcript_23550/m.60427 type:complete len:119 (+) Transcript_23550:4044-4400(+)